MSKAANSPLRDKMLELHRGGLDVKFTGENGAQVFMIKMKEGVPLDRHLEILEEVRIAIDRSTNVPVEKKLTASSARSFVEGIKNLNI